MITEQISNRSYTVNLIELNLAMLFISTSGVLGRYIDLPIPTTIGFRSMLAGMVLYIFCKWKRLNFLIEKKDNKIIIVGGVLLGLHWTAYFYALQLSNIAIGMLSLFTYPAITAILEPIILKTKILKFHLILCALVLIGVYLLVPDISLQNDHLKAVGFGVFSALCYSIRNIIMKSRINKYNGSVLMVYQLLIISIILLPSFFLMDNSNLVKYLPATILLAILTTSIGHTLFLYSLKYFSTVTASIISCTQPIYGIIIGMIFLQEYPQPTTVFGGGIIILTIVAESLRVYKLKKEQKST